MSVSFRLFRESVTMALQRGFYWQIVQCQLGKSASKISDQSGKRQHEIIAAIFVTGYGGRKPSRPAWTVTVCCSHGLCVLMFVPDCLCPVTQVIFSSVKPFWNSICCLTRLKAAGRLSHHTVNEEKQQQSPIIDWKTCWVSLNSVYYYHISLSKCKRLLCSFFLCCLRLSS